MNDIDDFGALDVRDHVSIGQKPSEISREADDQGAVRLGYAIESKEYLSLRQAAFNCLEVWGDHPNHIEPLYAAALLFSENNDVHLALMAAEYAMSIRVRPQMYNRWPFQDESSGWQLELLYARLLVRKECVADAMAHYGSVLLSCEDSARPTIKEEVLLASRRLPLCKVSVP